MKFMFFVELSTEELENLKDKLGVSSDDVVHGMLAEAYQEGSNGYFEESLELNKVPVLKVL